MKFCHTCLLFNFTPEFLFFFKLLTSCGFLSHVPQQLAADENPLKMGKITAANPRRAVLGEITNVNAAAAKVTNGFVPLSL